MFILFFLKKKEESNPLVRLKYLALEGTPHSPPPPLLQLLFLVPLGEGDLMVFGKTLYFIV